MIDGPELKLVFRLGRPTSPTYSVLPFHGCYSLIRMNYISKTILQHLLPQYVQIPEGSLLLQQAGIKLSKGQVKKERFNPVFKSIGVQIDQCSYLNIFVEVPWLEIHKKPIKITIQQLKGEISLRCIDEYSLEEIFAEQPPAIEKSGSGDYLKSVLTRLLFRMEIIIKSVHFVVRNRDEQVNLTLTIENLTIKNSSLSEDPKELIKTVLMDRLRICLNQVTIFDLRGLNLCLDVGQQHLKVICLISRVCMVINLKRLRQVQTSLSQIGKKQKSRTGSSSLIEQKQGANTGSTSTPRHAEIYFKLFQQKSSFQLSPESAVDLECRNVQYSARTGTKTKFSLTSLCVSDQNDPIFSITSSKTLQNSLYLINYNEAEQKAITDVEVQMFNLSPQHLSVKVFHLQISITQGLIALLKLHLSTIVSDINTLTQPTQQIQSDTSIQSEPSSNTNTRTLTLTIYQAVLQVSCIDDYRLYLSIQLVTNKGCLYEFNCMQISIRGKDTEMLKVYDVEVRVTEDDVFLGIQFVQIQIWTSAIKFFVDLMSSINSIIQSLPNKNQGLEVSKNKPQVDGIQQSEYKSLLIVRNTKLVYGNILPKGEHSKFIDLIEVSIQDLKIVLSTSNQVQCSLAFSLAFTQQHSLLQQAISNIVHVSFVNTSDRGMTLKIRNSISLKLESRYLKYLIASINNNNNYITVTNFTKSKLRITSNGCAPLQLQPRISSHWFPLANNFRIQSPQSRASTEEIKLNFQVDQDVEVPFLNSKELVYLRLVKTSISKYHVLIKPSFRVLNCVKEFVVVNEQHKIEMKVQSCEYDKIDFSDQQSLQMKSCDFGKMGSYIDKDGEQGLLFMYSNNQVCSLVELVTKDGVSLFALKNKLTQNYNNYAILKSKVLMVMPFLVLKNNTDSSLVVNILEKKTSKSIEIRLAPNSEVIPDNNQSFDFYMRQLTVRVSLDSFDSEEYYFNTFAFLSEPHEQAIPLRSTQKGSLDRKHLLFRETAKLRTKYLQFTTPITFANCCDFLITLKVTQRNTSNDIALTDQPTHLNICLKSDYTLQLLYEDQLETKVTLQTSKLKQNPLVVSFNFCKIGDKFRNVLVLCQLQRVAQKDVVTFSPFITIKNLTTLPITVQQSLLKPQQECSLTLSASHDNKYNNRGIQLSTITPASIFDDLLVTETNQGDVNVSVGNQSIGLASFLKETMFEVIKLRDKRILRIVKDTQSRISLYIIQGIHSHATEQKYTIINNQSPHYFLVSENPVFFGLFKDSESKQTRKLSKMLIEPYTSSTIMSKSNYDILLCDGAGQKLTELNKQTLSVAQIHEAKNTFGNVQTRVFQQRTGQFQGVQFGTKTVEFELSIDGELFLAFQVRSLKIRKLEPSKYDVLVNQFLLKDLKKGVNVLLIKQSAYAILDFSHLNGSMSVIRNLFIKLSSIELDLRKEFLMNLVRFSRLIGRQNTQSAPGNSKKVNLREQALLEVLRSKLYLVRNIFVEEFMIHLNIEIDALVLQNDLQMPSYKLASTAIQSKKLFSELWRFYSSALVSKFPKLTFLLQNLRHPLNIVKNILNLRQTLNTRTVDRLTYWPYASRYSPSLMANLIPEDEFIACIVYSIDRIVLLSNRSLILQQYTPVPCRANKWKIKDLRRVQSLNQWIQMEFSDKSILQVAMTNRDQRLLMRVLNYFLQ